VKEVKAGSEVEEISEDVRYLCGRKGDQVLGAVGGLGYECSDTRPAISARDYGISH
jgi:hypothetical protein